MMAHKIFSKDGPEYFVWCMGFVLIADSCNFSPTVIVLLTFCMLGIFFHMATVVVDCWLLLKLKTFMIFMAWQNVKWFGPRSGPTFCWLWPRSKLFAKVIIRGQKSQPEAYCVIWAFIFWINERHWIEWTFEPELITYAISMAIKL